VRLAREAGAKLVINTDAHSPSDLITRAFAVTVGVGAGLTVSEVDACFVNSETLVKRLTGRSLG
jgi:histidinol phosphatase-like PHP family hydrolase